MKKFELLKHKEKWGNENVICDLCKLDFKRKKIYDHKKNCPNRIVKCDKCQEKYLFKNGHGQKDFNIIEIEVY